MDYSVEQVYDKIAKEFDITRNCVWGKVKEYLDNIPSNSNVLEIGCGNGKNMLYRNDLNFYGMDISKEQVNICQSKGLNVKVGNMVKLDYDNNLFDHIICIATYHHLDNDIDRMRALDEMYRCVKPGGYVYITVWAMEQPEQIKNTSKKISFNFTKEDEMVPWKSKDGNIYYRYYHIYKKDDLENEIYRLCPYFKIINVEYELGNWMIKLQKN